MDKMEPLHLLLLQRSVQARRIKLESKPLHYLSFLQLSFLLSDKDRGQQVARFAPQLPLVWPPHPASSNNVNINANAANLTAALRPFLRVAVTTIPISPMPINGSHASESDGYGVRRRANLRQFA